MARVRPTVFEDAEAIGQVHLRNGMGPLDPRAWRECWESYPYAEEFRDIPIGWVLENDTGAVVGSLGNIHMLYDLGGRRIKASVATAWAVDAEYRGKSLQLMTTFFRQKGVDLWMDGSASPVASQVLAGLKIARIPVPEYNRPCFWAVRPRAFAKAALVRRSTPGAAALSWPAGLVLLGRDIFRRSGRGRPSSTVRRLEKFDGRFDSLWQSIAAGPVRLRAVRTRAALEWRFRLEMPGSRAMIVAAERGGTLSGYAVLVRREGSELGMELLDVADIQAAGDDPEILRDLLLGSIRIARGEGADAVKFMSGTPAKRIPAEALAPYTYRLPFWQLYYKATPELGAALGSADAWDFSLFDTY